MREDETSNKTSGVIVVITYAELNVYLIKIIIKLSVSETLLR